MTPLLPRVIAALKKPRLPPKIWKSYDEKEFGWA
jgi:hypothetical protein